VEERHKKEETRYREDMEKTWKNFCKEMRKFVELQKNSEVHDHALEVIFNDFRNDVCPCIRENKMPYYINRYLEIKKIGSEFEKNAGNYVIRIGSLIAGDDLVLGKLTKDRDNVFTVMESCNRSEVRKSLFIDTGGLHVECSFIKNGTSYHTYKHKWNIVFSTHGKYEFFDKIENYRGEHKEIVKEMVLELDKMTRLQYLNNLPSLEILQLEGRV
jgi:hypothetical protein